MSHTQGAVLADVGFVTAQVWPGAQYCVKETGSSLHHCPVWAVQIGASILFSQVQSFMLLPCAQTGALEQRLLRSGPTIIPLISREATASRWVQYSPVFSVQATFPQMHGALFIAIPFVFWHAGASMQTSYFHIPEPLALVR